MKQEYNISLSGIGQLLIYVIILGVNLISIPKTGMSNLITRCLQAMEMSVFLILFIPHIKNIITLNRYHLYVNLWWMLYIIITYMHPHTMGFTPFFWWLHVGLFLLVGTRYWADNFLESTKWLSILLSGLIYLNAILLILYPEGLWIDESWIGRGSPVRYLFGNYNQIGFVCLLGISIHAIYTFQTKKGYINLYALIAASLFSVVFVGSMTSTIGLLILASYILFHKMIKRPMLILTIFCTIYIVAFVFVIWLGNSIEEFPLFTDFIENTLNKDTTFSKRTTIWGNAVKEIAHSPILGHGIQNVEWNDEHIGGSGPHNLWLMLLLQGGFALCIGFLAITIYAIRSALRANTLSATTAVVALCVLFTMSFFETYNIVLIFSLIQITHYTKTLTQKEESFLSRH